MNDSDHNNYQENNSGPNLTLPLTLLFIFSVVKLFIYLGEAREKEAFRSSEAGQSLQQELLLMQQCRKMYPDSYFQQQNCEDTIREMISEETK